MDAIKKKLGIQVPTIDVHAAKNFDVRTEEEFKNGHPENALNIPYMFDTVEGRVKNPKFLEQVLDVCGKEDKLVVGCQSVVRSVDATTDLLDAEFKHVRNMGGGYIAWLAWGYWKNVTRVFQIILVIVALKLFVNLLV